MGIHSPNSKEDNAIEDALSLFEASMASKTALGQRVTTTLRMFQKGLHIQFVPMKPGDYGNSEDNWAGRMIHVNEAIIAKVAEVSIAMVHEGVHRSITIHKDYMDEELECRAFQVTYWNELIGGVTFSTPLLGSVRQTIDRNSNVADSKTSQDWLLRNQLVDYLVSLDLPDNISYRKSLTDKWIRDHINDWGGLAHRWGKTKGYYLAVLSQNDANRELIVHILESVHATNEWDDLEGAIGDHFAKTQWALRGLGNTVDLGPRIRQIEAIWNVHLGG